MGATKTIPWSAAGLMELADDRARLVSVAAWDGLLAMRVVRSWTMPERGLPEQALAALPARLEWLPEIDAAWPSTPEPQDLGNQGTKRYVANPSVEGKQFPGLWVGGPVDVARDDAGRVVCRQALTRVRAAGHSWTVNATTKLVSVGTAGAGDAPVAVLKATRPASEWRSEFPVATRTDQPRHSHQDISFRHFTHESRSYLLAMSDADMATVLVHHFGGSFTGYKVGPRAFSIDAETNAGVLSMRVSSMPAPEDDFTRRLETEDAFRTFEQEVVLNGDPDVTPGTNAIVEDTEEATEYPDVTRTGKSADTPKVGVEESDATDGDAFSDTAEKTVFNGTPTLEAGATAQVRTESEQTKYPNVKRNTKRVRTPKANVAEATQEGEDAFTETERETVFNGNNTLTPGANDIATDDVAQTEFPNVKRKTRTIRKAKSSVEEATQESEDAFTETERETVFNGDNTLTPGANDIATDDVAQTEFPNVKRKTRTIRKAKSSVEESSQEGGDAFSDTESETVFNGNPTLTAGANDIATDEERQTEFPGVKRKTRTLRTPKANVAEASQEGGDAFSDTESQTVFNGNPTLTAGANDIATDEERQTEYPGVKRNSITVRTPKADVAEATQEGEDAFSTTERETVFNGNTTLTPGATAVATEESQQTEYPGVKRNSITVRTPKSNVAEATQEVGDAFSDTESQTVFNGNPTLTAGANDIATDEERQTEFPGVMRKTRTLRTPKADVEEATQESEDEFESVERQTVFNGNPTLTPGAGAVVEDSESQTEFPGVRRKTKTVRTPKAKDWSYSWTVTDGITTGTATMHKYRNQEAVPAIPDDSPSVRVTPNFDKSNFGRYDGSILQYPLFPALSDDAPTYDSGELTAEQVDFFYDQETDKTYKAVTTYTYRERTYKRSLTGACPKGWEFYDGALNGSHYSVGARQIMFKKVTDIDYEVTEAFSGRTGSDSHP